MLPKTRPMLSSAEPCGCAVDWDAATIAAAEILESAYHVDLYKALDPLDPDDFLAIAQTLANELGKITAPLDKAAVGAAIDLLDVDWYTLSDSQRAELVRAVNLGMRDIPAKVMPALTAKAQVRLRETVRNTKASAAVTFKLDVKTSLTAVDKEMVDSVASFGSWVTDEYGRRASMFANGVDQIVRDGMATGLRSKDIGQDIRKLGHNVSAVQPANYWRLVASNLSNRARSYGNLRSMGDAGIVNYVFYAVMDERTTLICQMLHETVFPVSSGLGRFEELRARTQAGDYTAAERLMPFTRQVRLPDGSIEVYVEPPGGARTTLGVALENTVGQVDTQPPMRDLLSPGELSAAGASVPPLHHFCRSVILPDI